MREWIRKTIPGSTVAYEETRLRWKARRTKTRVEEILKTRSPIQLDIGAGDVHRPDWVTLDISDGCDLFWDLRNGIPFPNSSVDVVYSSHLLEHMPYEAGQDVLTEALRALKPGGVVSMCVPNARLYINAYLEIEPIAPDHDFWEPALVSRSGIDLLNYVAYMGGEHACLFDQESLITRLERAGFTDVTARDFDAAIDLPERAFESIYAQGFKPLS
jgi:predicted SAM-dependent methyltransferase